MIFVWLVSAAVLSFLLSGYFRVWSLKTKFALAKPRERDLHTAPTPRIGGFAIVATFVVIMLALAIFAPKSWTDFGFPFAFWGFSIDKRLLGILVAVIILSAVMVYDDIKGAPAYLKLFFQILAAVILIFTGVGLVYLNNPFGNTIYLDTVKIPFQFGADVYHLVLYADLFFLFWVLMLTNATNFIDGLDGLSSTLVLISVVIVGILSYGVGQVSTALMCAVVAGAIIGFLPYNLPPAKIFLGDTGSMFLGLILAVLTVITGGKLATVLLVFGLAIIDAVYVVIRRIIAGKNPFVTPDQTHLHHRFLRAGFSKQATLAIISGLSLLFGLAGLFLIGKAKIFCLLVLVAVVVVLFILLDRKAPPSFKRQV